MEKSTSIYIYITGYLPTFASKTTVNKRERVRDLTMFALFVTLGVKKLS